MSTEEPWKYHQTYPQEAVTRLAYRLKQEWLSFKKTEKVTQTIAAEKLGLSQAAFAQFLSGACPVSNSQLVKICDYMQISPFKLVQGIPFFEKFFDSVLVHQENVEVKYVLGNSEKLNMHIDRPFEPFEKYEVAVADDRFKGIYNSGTRIVVAILPIPLLIDGWDIFIKTDHESDFVIGQYIKNTNQAKIYDLEIHGHLSGQIIELYNAELVHLIISTARIAPKDFAV